MTIPAGIGYPDWRRSFATARFFDILAFNSTITQSTTFGPFPVANIDSIGVRCFALVGHGLLTFEWFADEAMTFFLTGDQISMRDDRAIDQSIVVKGAFLLVTVANVEPADWELTLIIYETTRSVIAQSSPTDNILISQLNTAVGAGATVTVEVLRMWIAEAQWVVVSSLAAWAAELRAIDHLGTQTRIDVMTQVQNGDSRTEFLPACSVRAVFTNSTGGAGTFTMFLSGKPGISGF